MSKIFKVSLVLKDFDIKNFSYFYSNFDNSIYGPRSLSSDTIDKIISENDKIVSMIETIKDLIPGQVILHHYENSKIYFVLKMEKDTTSEDIENIFNGISQNKSYIKDIQFLSAFEHKVKNYKYDKFISFNPKKTIIEDISSKHKNKIFKIKISLFSNEFNHEEQDSEYKKYLKEIKFKKSSDNYTIDEHMIKDNHYLEVIEHLEGGQMGEGKLILAHYEDESITFVIKFYEENNIKNIKEAIMEDSIEDTMYSADPGTTLLIPYKSFSDVIFAEIDYRNEKNIQVEIL